MSCHNKTEQGHSDTHTHDLNDPIRQRISCLLGRGSRERDYLFDNSVRFLGGQLQLPFPDSQYFDKCYTKSIDKK